MVETQRRTRPCLRLWPCTFQPGCGYPESATHAKSRSRGSTTLPHRAQPRPGAPEPAASAFPPSRLHCARTSLKNYPIARGRQRGPLAWTTTADALAQGQNITYAFAGTSAFVVPIDIHIQSVRFLRRAEPRSWPGTKPPFTFKRRDPHRAHQRSQRQHRSDQHRHPPAFSLSQAPTIIGEADHADTIPSTPGWSQLRVRRFALLVHDPCAPTANVVERPRA